MTREELETTAGVLLLGGVIGYFGGPVALGCAGLLWLWAVVRL